MHMARHWGFVGCLAGVAAAVLGAGGCNNDEKGPAPPEEPLTSAIVVNEFLARNDSTLADEAGQYDDWIELWNSGTAAQSTRGLYLTDNFAVPLKWALSDTTLAPGGFLLVWADTTTLQGRWHASFALDGDGEEIALYQVTAETGAFVDTVTFASQGADTSSARQPTGKARDSRLRRDSQTAERGVRNDGEGSAAEEGSR
jgi:hypothetical protein